MSNLLGLKTGRPSGRTAEHVKGLMDNAEEEKRLNVIMPAGEYQALKMYATVQKKNNLRNHSYSNQANVGCLTKKISK